MTEPEEMLDPEVQRWFAETTETMPKDGFVQRSQQLRHRSHRKRVAVYWLLTLTSAVIAVLASEPVLTISDALMQPLLPIPQPFIAMIMQPLNCVGGLLVMLLFGLRVLLRSGR